MDSYTGFWLLDIVSLLVGLLIYARWNAQIISFVGWLWNYFERFWDWLILWHERLMSTIEKSIRSVARRLDRYIP